MVAASQGLFFISSPHEGGNKNPFLKCYAFKTMLIDKEEKVMTMMMLMINQHNDGCKRV
jgi:pantothenate kinase